MEKWSNIKTLSNLCTWMSSKCRSSKMSWLFFSKRSRWFLRIKDRTEGRGGEGRGGRGRRNQERPGKGGVGERILGKASEVLYTLEHILYRPTANRKTNNRHTRRHPIHFTLMSASIPTESTDRQARHTSKTTNPLHGA